jgi:uracil phosphoribosyltransferase
MSADDLGPGLPLAELRTKVNLVEHPVIRAKMTALRRSETSSKNFRELLREVASFLGFAATADLATRPVKVNTPVGEYTGAELETSVCLVPVMRSGMGLLDAMLDVLPSAPVFHLGLYRDKRSLLPVLYYNKLPRDCFVQRAIVLDPLIATAGTVVAVVEILKEWGAKDIHIISVIASRPGLTQLLQTHPDVKVHVCAIDEKLNDKGYIEPGLGDAGDRLFGIPPHIVEPPTPVNAPKRPKLN